MEPLQTPTHDCFRYIPFINDDCYFYCNANGDLLHIGNNLTGEFLGSIPIGDIVEENDLPAKYNRSTDTHNSNHMEYYDGLYMISIRHEAIAQDDWLYFGEFDLSPGNVSFNIGKKICSYEEPATATVIVRCNYYYGGYFWQYRTDNFSPNVCAVRAEDLNVVYTIFIPAITGIYEYYDYLLGFFDIYIKKSFDNGFTWEDWAVMNAPWVHEEIAGVNVLFFSHNLSSVNFDLLETVDYAEGELEGHCITNLIEFDGRVFAGTMDGLYYCDLEDFFITDTTVRKGSENTAKIEILQIE
jgi:hypothetical protein